MRSAPVSVTPAPWRGLAWAVAVFVAVIAIGAILFALTGDGSEPVDEPTTTSTLAAPSTTTTAAPTTTSTTTTEAPTTTLDIGNPEADVALAIEAIEAWYAGDFETVSALLEIPGGPGWDEDDVRNQVTYDSMAGGRAASLQCETPKAEGEFFRCKWRMENTFSDALELDLPEELGDWIRVRVVDGKLTRWQFPDHSFVGGTYAEYLEAIGAFNAAAYAASCQQPPFTIDCVTTQLEHIDEWAVWWHENVGSV